jgi:site-specific DNA-methyltransferase (adenine-specific)
MKGETKGNIKVEYVDIDELKPSEYNPRKASKKEYEDLRRSIERFGLVDPLIVNSAENRKNVVIGGHFRLKVAKDLGIKQVPVVYVNIPDIEKEQELNLRLNRNTGEWDFDLLANFDENLLKDVGFEGFELDRILDWRVTDKEEEEEIPEAKETEIKYGDMFQLGKHRLMCGDATSKEDIERLCGGFKISMVFADPPFDMDFETLERAFKNLYDISDLQFWMGSDKQAVFLAQDKRFAHFFVHDFRSMKFVSYRQPERQHALIGKFGSRRINTLHDGFSTIIPVPATWVDRNRLFTYEKRPELPLAFILHYTQRGEVVLDPFCGSGSTLVACEKSERICLTMDIDPFACQMTIDRWKRTFNGKVEKIEREGK